MNHKIAYTLVKTSSYDQLPSGTLELGLRKSAEGQDDYAGAWVFKTIDEANEFRFYTLRKLCPFLKPEDFSIYELELPNGWVFDVLPKQGTDFVCHLINDAILIGKVQI